MQNPLKAVVAASFGLLLFSVPASADVIGTTSGVFVNPQPSSNCGGGAGSCVFTGVGTNTFTWGQGQPPPPNEMQFTGTSFNSPLETQFNAGSLFYFNGTTTSGTVPTSVDLQLTMNFTTPAQGP